MATKCMDQIDRPWPKAAAASHHGRPAAALAVARRNRSSAVQEPSTATTIDITKNGVWLGPI